MKIKLILIPLLCLCAGLARAATFDLTTATISDIHAAVDSGKLTYEKLVQLYIERIAAYDKCGPSINAVITVNARALSDARALDAEYKAKGRRSPLHGIPVAVKDCIDTLYMADSGGALALRNSFPNQDAFVVQQLRAAGAIIFLKTNLAEFAGSADGLNSACTLGGQPRNPYNLDRHPDGSSSGTAAGLAAVFATVGLGTETGSSTRGPAYHNNLVGLAPTEGLVSRSGVIPNSWTLDRVGLLGRYVSDVAMMLSHSTGLDTADTVTSASAGHIPSTYEKDLRVDGLKGARIGVFRAVFTSNDPRHKEAQAIANAAIEDLKKAGAIVLDPVKIPENVEELTNTPSLGPAETAEWKNKYFAGLPPEAPIHNLEELLRDGGILYNKFEPFKAALTSGPTDKYPGYTADLAKRAKLRAALTRLLDGQKLDALVYLHNLYPAQYINELYPYTKVKLSSVSGLPGLVVPSGFTSLDQSVGIEFLGRAFDEAKLLRLGYSYEQPTKHLRLPATTHSLPR